MSDGNKSIVYLWTKRISNLTKMFTDKKLWCIRTFWLNTGKGLLEHWPKVLQSHKNFHKSSVIQENWGQNASFDIICDGNWHVHLTASETHRHTDIRISRQQSQLFKVCNTPPHTQAHDCRDQKHNCFRSDLCFYILCCN